MKKVYLFENNEELMKILGSQVENAVGAAFTKVQISPKKEKEERYMSRQSVAEKFHCSLSTVHRMVNRGVLNCYKFGRKSLFKFSEVDNALIQLKKGGNNYGF